MLFITGYALVQLPDMIFYMYDYVHIQVQRKKALITHSNTRIESGKESFNHFEKSNSSLNNVSHQEDSIVDMNIPTKNHQTLFIGNKLSQIKSTSAECGSKTEIIHK